MSTMYSPSMDARIDKKQEYRDNTDRIEAERFISRNKRCYGMGCIVTKPEETQKNMVRGRRYKLKVA